LIVAFSLGCSSKINSLLPASDKVLDSNLTSNFPDEDRLVIFALDAQNHGKFKEASNYYAKLYDRTGKIAYAKEAIKNGVVSKDYKSIKNILDKAEANQHHDPTLDSYLVAYYIDKKKFDKAKKLTDNLLKEERSAKNLELAGLVSDGLGEKKKALSYFEESYQKDKSAYSLLKMTDILYIKMDQKQKATRLLETDIAINGCSETICARLIQFYSHNHDSYGIANILEKLYKKTKNPSVAEKLMQLYASTKNYDKAINFLKENKFDDLLLLDIYTSKKDYKSALELSEKLYEEKGDPILLARSAILEYESSQNKKSKKLFESVSKKFDKVIDILKDPLYYNYYGYLLIDLDVDVDRGIKLVKKALEKDPKSLFYIDSLAWGLYKKGDCQEAYKLLYDAGKDSPEEEIVDHLKIIKKCNEGK
jgi:tetratricopeptide (TPR) repeat protein